ncbi:transcriptional regulator [Nocardia sp. NPDC004068]|uniref:transcriptional regulator n=1 Tax=Nocardia sp. NPDC004068 TaxID=3364303 RepID=UPI0036A69E76
MSAPHRRPALILLVIVAALACLGLGWWQWGRFESASGTAQNLGYALQWPLFAGFVVFAYFRFVRLERETGDPEAEKPAKPVAPLEIPPGILPERPTAARPDDPVLAEYNKYLAELHARDLHEQTRAAGLDARDTERSAG